MESATYRLQDQQRTTLWIGAIATPLVPAVLAVVNVLTGGGTPFALAVPVGLVLALAYLNMASGSTTVDVSGISAHRLLGSSTWTWDQVGGITVKETVWRGRPQRRLIVHGANGRTRRLPAPAHWAFGAVTSGLADPRFADRAGEIIAAGQAHQVLY